MLAEWLPKSAFVLVKATEGKGYRSASYTERMPELRASSAPAGAYHYAWPENGWEADYANFKAHSGLRVGEVGALDFEPWSSSQPLAVPADFPAYVIGWADAFKADHGVDPLFYAPDVFVREIRARATSEQWARIAALPFWKPGKDGAYVTDPAVGPGDTFGFESLAMWQWTSTPLDQDILYADWAHLAATRAPA